MNTINISRDCPTDGCDGKLYAERRNGTVVYFKCHGCGAEIEKDYS